MTDESQGLNLNLESTLALLRVHAILIIASVMVVSAAAFGISNLQTKQYTASAKLLFRNPGLDQQASGLATPVAADPQHVTATNIALIKLGDVAALTARQIGQGITPARVLRSVSVAPNGATDVATISATSTRPSQAADIANTFTRQFIATRRQVDQDRVRSAERLVDSQIALLSPEQQAGLQGQALRDRRESLHILASLQTGGAEQVERATVPVTPSSPKVLRNTAIGALLGLLLGLGIAALRVRLDQRMKEPEDLTSVFGLPLLGVVPESTSFSGALADGTSLPPREREAFRLLRAHLRYFNVDRELRTVLVTSANSGEGKSTVATFMALAAVEMGTKTLLIEADLRRPTVGRRLAPSRGGLGEVLIGALSAPDAIRAVSVSGRINGASAANQLHVLPVGAIPPNPAQLIESRAMEELLSWAAAEYQLVVIDTPPLTIVSDAIPLLRRVDGVVIVSRFGQATHDAAEQLRQRLASLGAPVLGVVGNAYVEHNAGKYGYTPYMAEISDR